MGIPINVVFDIDGTLADWAVAEPEDIKFFQQKGCVFTAVKTHYVFPGVIELMQLLCKEPDVRISFFSGGERRRNELFVQKLLTKALGEQEYSNIKHKIRILSGTNPYDEDDLVDLVWNRKIDDESQSTTYGLASHNRKKSLNKIISSPDELENCILVDDTPSYIAAGQEGNYLHIPEGKAAYFNDLKRNKNIHLQCNQICYIAGVLFRAIEHVRSGGAMTNYLFPLHFSSNPDGTTFSPLFCTKNACHNREEYYNYGLEKLKEANPNYTFIDRQLYLDCLQKELTREEQEELENLHSQQACLLM